MYSYVYVYIYRLKNTAINIHLVYYIHIYKRCTTVINLQSKTKKNKKNHHEYKSVLPPWRSIYYNGLRDGCTTTTRAEEDAEDEEEDEDEVNLTSPRRKKKI